MWSTAAPASTIEPGIASLCFRQFLHVVTAAVAKHHCLYRIWHCRPLVCRVLAGTLKQSAQCGGSGSIDFDHLSTFALFRCILCPWACYSPCTACTPRECRTRWSPQSSRAYSPSSSVMASTVSCASGSLVASVPPTLEGGGGKHDDTPYAASRVQRTARSD